MQNRTNGRKRIGYAVLMLAALLGIITVAGTLRNNAPAATPQTDVAQISAAKARPAAPSNAGLNAAVAGNSQQPQEQTFPNGARVVTEVKHDVSPPLRDIPPAPVQIKSQENENPVPFKLSGGAKVKDTVVQNFFGPLAMPTPIVNFDGIDSVASGCGCLPPDTNGDVGPNHYVQTVNTAFAIYSKTGTVIQTARPVNTVFAGFGGPCQIHNDGDPVVLYDSLADRWFISQFTAESPYGMCIAVSTTPDPTGAYNRYFFQLSTTDFYDYEKYGVWPDGYYMTANIFQNGQNFLRPTAIAFDRVRMLAGLSATFVEFNPGNFYANLLPSDVDGLTPPPAGEPNFFLTVSGNLTQLHLWRFHVDFATPGNSTFTGPFNINAAPWDPDLCGLSRNCIPQPPPSNPASYLDSLGDHTMFRLAYRNMGDHEVLLTTESVDANGNDQSGVRWYELRSPNGTPVVYQQGTYAPDADSRWMGSIAMDRDSNIAVGYSVSSVTTFPSVRYAGRLSTDPLGQLAQGEASLIAGTGVQLSTSGRWGDYSNMSIDPSDDCTFWYTQEYHGATGNANWRTRIGSFKFPGCGQTTPTPTSTGTPPTNTPQPTSTNTPLPLPTICANYSVATGSGTVTPATQLVGLQCDDCAKQISLPFPISLYDQSFTIANISSNGVLEFASSDFAFGSACLPVPIYAYTIAGFWDDLLLTSSGQGVYSATTGSAPNRTFTLEWRATDIGAPGNPAVNFEIILHEGSANFEVQYGTTTGGLGISATTGVQRDQASFTQFSCNTAAITPGLLLSYTIPNCPPPPTASPTTAPPTSTSTPTNAPPTSTSTSVPPTNTSTGTSVPPTSTSTVASTSTSGPTNTVGPTNTTGPTDTPVPAITNTPYPTATACNMNFTDVSPEDWFYGYVEYLFCRNVVQGYNMNPPCDTGAPCFKPGNTTTRGQVSKIIVGAFNFAINTTGGPHFSDVPVGSTFYTYIETVRNLGLLEGYPDGTYQPYSYVTRGQIAKITVNAAIAVDPSHWTLLNPPTNTYEDVPVGSTFFRYVETATAHHVVSGYPCGIPPAGVCVPPGNKNYYLPDGNATRAQISKIVFLAVTYPPAPPR